MEYDKTSVKKGVSCCSRKKLLLLLLSAQVTFLVVLYFSCQNNTFDCQSMTNSFSSSINKLWNQQEKRKRNSETDRSVSLTNTTKNVVPLNVKMSLSNYTGSPVDASSSFVDKTDPKMRISREKKLDINRSSNLHLNESSDILNTPRILIENFENITQKYGPHIRHKNPTQLNNKTLAEYNSTLNEAIIRFNSNNCATLHPEVLLYNRIFKTASSTVEQYIETESKHLNYTFEKATTEDWYKTGDPWPYPDIIPHHVARTTSRYAFVGHFFFRRSLGIDRPYTYINVVREPVRRVISHYAYMRTNMRPAYRIEEMKKSGQWNETLPHCVEMEHRGCESNVMVHFFCGPYPFCRTGSRRALKLAKTNIRRYYSVVGMQEDLPSFLRILTHILPDFFLHDHVKLGQVKQNRQTYFEKVKPGVKRMIGEKNKADSELYRFVKNRFQRLMKKCKKHRGIA